MVYFICIFFSTENICCIQVTCDMGQFICPTYKNTTNARICVNQKHICDGQYDCLKGEDESDENCPKVNPFYEKN